MKRPEIDSFLPNKPIPRWRKGIKTAAVATVATIATLYPHQTADALLPYHKTDQESELAAAYNSTFSTFFASLHCVPEDYLSKISLANVPEGYELKGVGLPFTDTVWLGQKTCDRLSDFAADPPQAEDFKNGGRPFYTQIAALHFAVHEGAHGLHNIMTESGAECRAAETAGAMAMALGMQPDLQDELRTYMVTLQKDEQTGMPSQYGFQPDCAPYQEVMAQSRSK